MFTTVAYYASVDPAGIETKIAPVPDVSVRISGNDLYVPALNRLSGAAAMVSTTVSVAYAKLSSPSLLRVQKYAVSPIQGVSASVNLPADPHAVHLIQAGPPQLNTNEGLDALVNSDPAAPQIHSVIVWLSDGVLTPVQPDEQFTIRATGTTTLTAGTWTPVPLVFDDAIPVGRYSIVGMRAESSNMLAARLVVPGYAWRPGVLGCINSLHREDFRFRRGLIGEFAQFDAVTLFQVEVLAAAADTAERFVFDIDKIG